MAKITIEIDDADLWSEIFGSGFEKYPWWDAVDYLSDANWETPGAVALTLIDPDTPQDPRRGGYGVVETRHLEKAASEVLQTYPHRNIFDMDAELADMILQTAVAGRVIFG